MNTVEQEAAYNVARSRSPIDLTNWDHVVQLKTWMTAVDDGGGEFPAIITAMTYAANTTLPQPLRQAAVQIANDIIIAPPGGSDKMMGKRQATAFAWEATTGEDEATRAETRMLLLKDGSPAREWP